MALVGFLHNCSTTRSPRETMGPSLLNRAILMDEHLKRTGDRLFIYSPKHVVDGVPDVPGYTIDDRTFTAATLPIPAANGNWTHRSRATLALGMGYRPFLRWCRRNRIGIYVPYEFTALVGSKLRTYELVRRFSPRLHPHTEAADHSPGQIASLFERGDTVFLKPRTGNMGNGIIVVRRDGAGFVMTSYEDGEKTVVGAPTLEAVAAHARAIAGERPYVIQQGLRTPRCDGAPFDIRVIMLHDGAYWHWIHNARVGAAGSDVSNVHQGGRSMATRDCLAAVFGVRGVDRLRELNLVAHGLAASLDTVYPGRIIEVAFDFIYDGLDTLHLAEINTKPGLAGIEPGSTVLDRRPDEQALYETYVVPHATCLARFLASKIHRRRRGAA